jgi:signal transduction histidine kinase
MTEAPRPWVLGAVVAGGLAAAAASITLAMTSDHVSRPGLQAALFNWITLAYVLSGVLAWWRRPESRFGPLMIVAGFGASMSNLAWANNPVLFTVGQAFDLVPLVVFLHVFLAFPTGRLGGRLERWLVGTGYLVGVGFQLFAMLLGAFGPDNVLAVTDQPGVVGVVTDLELLALSGLALAGIGVLAVRRRSRGRPLRRSLAMLVNAFALALVMIAVLLIAGLFAIPAFPTIQRITLAVIGLAPIAFLVGLLNAHLARAAVGGLVVELGTGPVDLRDSLARALDADGRQVELPTHSGDEPSRAVTMIDRSGDRVAALIHDAALVDEPELLDAVTAAAGIALDNGRLRAELHARLEELRGSRVRVIEAGQRERQRLERDLHDGAQQRLVAVSLDLGRLEASLPADAAARAVVAHVKQEVATSLDELRDVARGLYPAVLTGHGLEVALESLAALAPVPVRLTVRTEGRLAEPIEVAAYYVVCECLANVGKHARAASATVDVSRAGSEVVVEVVDDGVGGAATERGTGLRGLADRVEALDGRLRVWTPVGGGTRVRAELPCG